jgi:putative ABC transporter-associated repeat protein
MNRLGLRQSVAGATVTLAVVLTGGAPALATPDAEGADLIALSVESGELRMTFQDGGDPQSLRFAASGTPVGVVPDDPAFAFLGKPGRPVWSLQQGSPFSSFDTTAIATGGEVTLELVSVDGPGAFAAYTLSAWGRPTLLLDSDGRTSTRLSAGRRLGGVVWMFDAPGDYRVTLRASAPDGATTLRDEAVYTVSVPSPATTGPIGAIPETSTPTSQAGTPIPQDTGPAPGAMTSTGAAAGSNLAGKAAAKAATGTTPDASARATGATPDASTGVTGTKVIADGHVDMGPQLSGGTLTIRLKDDATTPPTWRELSDVTLKVTDKARIDVPSGAGYAFLGAAGDQVYLLPQSQQAGIVWPGWNTQHESVVNGTKGDVIWRLQQVSGPGEFKLFLTGSFGTPEVIFDSARSLPQRTAIAPNTHAHGNWAFTRAGVYRLTVEMTATTTAGRSVSDTRTLTLAVGDTTDTGTDGGPGAAGSDDGDGALARTGANVMSIAGGGALLFTVGTAVVALTRRRRGEPDHMSTPQAS